jgi:hypothetical protein
MFLRSCCSFAQFLSVVGKKDHGQHHEGEGGEGGEDGDGGSTT